MDLDGFHITTHKGHVGMQASASSIERATPLPTRAYAAWKYHDSTPESAKNIDRYYFDYEDITDRTGWTEREIKRLVRKHGWRWRFNHTTRERQYYLFDMLATSWAYLVDKAGTKISPDVDPERWALIVEARDYVAQRGSTTKQPELYFP